MAPVQDRYVTVNGLSFHYCDWGGTGRPMVLLHGLASNARLWDLVAPGLARHCRVVALDQRGHGGSAHPEGDYGFDTVTDDLRALVVTLGLERPVLVGHSWGGAVGLHYAARYPEGVAALVMIDGGFVDLARDPGLTWDEMQRFLAPPELDGLYREELLDMARTWNLGQVWSPQVEEFLLASFHQHADGTLSPCLNAENHLTIVRAIWEHSAQEMYPRIRCPVLAVPARRSDQPNAFMARIQSAKPAAVALLQSHVPGAEVAWMEETIHDVPLQRPGELAAAVLDFLRRHAV